RHATRLDLVSLPTRRSSDLAIGASARLMNLEMQPFRDMIYMMFIRKGEQIVDSNNEALKEGYKLMDSTMADISGDFEMVPSEQEDRKSTRLNSSHVSISYAV